MQVVIIYPFCCDLNFYFLETVFGKGFCFMLMHTGLRNSLSFIRKIKEINCTVLKMFYVVGQLITVELLFSFL